MWFPVSVRHDKGFLRVTERPMIEHIAETLNKLEQDQGGKIQVIQIIDHEEDKFAELVVSIEKNLT